MVAGSDPLGILRFRSAVLVHRILWALAYDEDVRLAALIIGAAEGERWSEKTIVNTIYDLEKVGAVRVKGKGGRAPLFSLTMLGEVWVGLREMPPAPSPEGWIVEDPEARQAARDFLS